MSRKGISVSATFWSFPTFAFPFKTSVFSLGWFSEDYVEQPSISVCCFRYVTTKDPDKPIGTHIFTVVARTDAGLRWTEVTIDNGDDAKDALDRITLPQEILDRIGPTAM